MSPFPPFHPFLIHSLTHLLIHHVPHFDQTLLSPSRPHIPQNLGPSTEMPPPSPLLYQTLTHNHHHHHVTNTPTFDAILTSLMAPLCGSDTVVRDRCGKEFDAWFLDSSSSLGLKPLAPVRAGNDMSGRCEIIVEVSADGAGEYDPRYPHLSTPPPVGFSNRRRGENMFPSQVEEYDPLNPSIQPPVSHPSPSPSPLHSTTPLPHFPSSSLPPSSSCPSALQKCEIAVLAAGKRRLWAGDRRRLEAMKRRRIEERRVVRGRDPVTGGRVVVCEDGKGRGKGKGIGGGRVGKGGGR